MADLIQADFDQELSDSLDKPVCDPGVPSKLLTAKLAGSPSVEAGGVSFNFGLGTEIAVLAFNSPDDVDDAGVLRPPSDAAEEDELPPQISLAPGHGWIKYQLAAQVKASAQTSLAALGLSIEGDKQAIFSDYHAHPCELTIGQALLFDTGELRVAARRRDIAKLSPREALAYQLRGALTTGIRLSLADGFTANLGSLAGLVRTDVPLAFKVDAGLSIAASVRLSDDYLVVFSRAAAGRTRVAVKKARASTAGVSGKLGVEVSFADPELITEVLESTLTGLIGVPFEQIDALFAKATFAELGSLEKRALRELQKRLGLEDLASDLEALKAKWEELKGKVQNTIVGIARARAEAGFTYEYQRIREHGTLLQAVLDDATLERFHRDLLKGRIADLVAWLRENETAVESYLHRRRVARSHSWGFSLGFGKWKLAATDRKQLEAVTRTDFEGRRKVSYLGVREYEASFGGDAMAWSVDFNAQMNDFARHPPPRQPGIDELELGLAIQWRWQERRLKRAELEGFLDQAVIWQALAEDDRADVVADLRGALGGDRAVSVTVGLTFPDIPFRTALARAAGSGSGELARCLAAAMPWWPKFPARTLIDRRTALYTPLWQAYLERPELHDAGRGELARFAGNLLRRSDFGKKIAGQERELGPRSELTFAGQAALHRGLLGDWHDWLAGLALLRDPARDHSAIPRAFEKMEEFWSQALYVRALGILLLTGATPNLAHVERSFRVDVEGESETRVYVGSGQTA